MLPPVQSRGSDLLQGMNSAVDEPGACLLLFDHIVLLFVPAV